MNFFMGTINSYVKNIEMQNKWQMKKESGDFKSDEKKKTELQIKNEQFKQSYQKMKELEEQHTDETLSSIHKKIEMGVKLTNEEMQYLQANDPMSYQKLKNLESEKKQYERELRQCKTKEDVQKLKFSKVSASLSTINSIKNNPKISDAQKLAISAHELRRLQELEKIAVKFVKSGEYEKLPTEAECRKAESEIKEAEYAEKEQSDLKEFNNDRNVDTDEKNDMSENNNDDKRNLSDGKLTLAEAEQTPEAKKLKRAKSKYSIISSNQNDLVKEEITVKI